MICGAIIGENNHTGIGGGCMANVVLPAKRECFRELKGLDVWIEQTRYVRDQFLATFSGVKFRNEFRKSFYASMQSAERISKKQLEIMRKWLDDARIYGLDAVLREIKDKLFDDFKPELECEELFNDRLDVHRKLYLSGRKDQKAAA
jgi:hypothetical protein